MKNHALVTFLYEANLNKIWSTANKLPCARGAKTKTTLTDIKYEFDNGTGFRHAGWIQINILLSITAGKNEK